MMKFFLLFVSLFIIPIAIAGHFYTGAATGYDSSDFYKTLKIINSSGQQWYDKKDNLDGEGWMGSGFIGYAGIQPPYYLAIEMSAQINSLKYHGYFYDQTVNQLSYATFTINKNLGLSLLPGFVLPNKTVLYARVGLIGGNFKYLEYKVNSGIKSGIAETQWLYGLNIGAGVLIPLKEKLQLRVEVNRINYQQYKNNTFPLAPDQLRTITLSPRTNQVDIGLIYYF